MQNAKTYSFAHVRLLKDLGRTRNTKSVVKKGKKKLLISRTHLGSAGPFTKNTLEAICSGHACVRTDTQSRSRWGGAGGGCGARANEGINSKRARAAYIDWWRCRRLPV